MSNTPISPKVLASGLTGVIASLLLAVVTLITPDLFDGLGKWSNLAYGLTIALVMAAAGYLKSEGAPADTSKDASSGDTPSVPLPDATRAPASFPAAVVEAAQAAEPAPVTPVYTPADPTTIA
jgi:hypothetical protein